MSELKWETCLQISEAPDIEEALTNFKEDSTEDNAVGLVQRIARYTGLSCMMCANFGREDCENTQAGMMAEIAHLKKKLESAEQSNAELAEQIDLNVVNAQAAKLVEYQKTFGTLLQAIFRLKADVETYAYIDAPAKKITESLNYKDLESAITQTQNQVIREIKQVAINDFVHDQTRYDNSLFASSLKERARVYLIGNRFDKRK